MLCIFMLVLHIIYEDNVKLETRHIPTVDDLRTSISTRITISSTAAFDDKCFFLFLLINNRSGLQAGIA